MQHKKVRLRWELNPAFRLVRIRSLHHGDSTCHTTPFTFAQERSDLPVAEAVPEFLVDVERADEVGGRQTHDEKRY